MYFLITILFRNEVKIFFFLKKINKINLNIINEYPKIFFKN